MENSIVDVIGSTFFVNSLAARIRKEIQVII
jgi:hypothetical protein